MLLEYLWLLGTFVNSSCDVKKKSKLLYKLGGERVKNGKGFMGEHGSNLKLATTT